MKTFFTLMIFLLATSICHAEINVKVKLKQVRDNGRNWDVFEGNPDPVICITLDSGPRKGASACFASFGNKNKIRGMKTAILRSSRLTSQAPLSTLGVGAGICRNRLECSFKDIQVGDNDFTLYIFDQDPSLSPLAGYIEHEGDRYFYYNMDNVDSLMVTNTEFDKPKGKQFIYTGSKNSKPHPITKNRADISVNDFTEYMLKYSTYGYFAYVDWEEVEKLKRQSGQSTIKCFLSRLFLLGTPSNDIAPYQISESDGIRLLKKDDFGGKAQMANNLLKSILENASPIYGISNIEIIRDIIRDAGTDSVKAMFSDNLKHKQTAKPSLPMRINIRNFFVKLKSL